MGEGCDVCFYHDADCSAEFYEESEPKARKNHKCCECRRLIVKGERYHSAAGKWDGDFLTFKTCSLCDEIRRVFACDGNWVFGNLWEDMVESSFPNLTTASTCFRELSPAAKQFVLDRWTKWKGLR